MLLYGKKKKNAFPGLERSARYSMTYSAVGPDFAEDAHSGHEKPVQPVRWRRASNTQNVQRRGAARENCVRELRKKIAHARARPAR